jgi:hypothetical protein
VECEYDPDARRLRLRNGLVEAEWRVGEQGELICSRLLHIPTGTDWLVPSVPAPLYSLLYSDPRDPAPRSDAWPRPLRTVVGTERHEVRRVTIAETEDARVEALIEAVPLGTPLRMCWHLQCNPGHAAIRQWATVTNTGDEPVVIARLPILTWTLGRPEGALEAYCGLGRRSYQRRDEWPDWFTWRSLDLPPGTADSVRSGYRREATWLGLLTPGGGPGIYLGWESNARSTCDFGDLHGDGAVWAECHIEPEYVLQPGETLTGPAGFTGLAHGDLDELSYRCQRYVEDAVAWQVEDERFPYVVFNSWGYGAEIDDASMRRCFEVCRRLGVELFVVDFGWEDPDWNPLEDRFPDGLAPLAEAAHEAGMLFGIHLSFGNLSPLSSAYREHPEWANGPGMWAYRREGEVYGLTLGNPETREWIVGKIVEILDENKIDYFLTDHYLWGPCNPEVQELHATNDYVTVAEGFDRVMERVRELRPHVLMEHCDNGMGLPTFKMVRQHVTSIGPDAVGTLWERFHTWRISRVLPPRYLDHYACDQVVPGEYVGAGLGDYEYRSHIFGGPMILMTNIMSLEEGSEEWESLARQIGLFKRIRRRVREGKVLHLLEPQPLERVGSGWDGWDAIGSYHEATDTAVILAFRLGGGADERVIPLHGLRAETSYVVRFEDRPDTCVHTGAELMAGGIRLSLPRPGEPPKVDPNGMVRASEVIFLEPADGAGMVPR